MKIVVRPLTQSDEAFVYATYLRNRWFDTSNKTTLKRSTWCQLQHKRLETIMANDVVLVACLSDDTDTIIGYVLRDGLEPWAYIKLAWRSPGLAIKEKLLEAIE